MKLETRLGDGSIKFLGYLADFNSHFYDKVSPGTSEVVLDGAKVKLKWYYEKVSSILVSEEMALAFKAYGSFSTS